MSVMKDILEYSRTRRFCVALAVYPKVVGYRLSYCIILRSLSLSRFMISYQIICKFIMTTKESLCSYIEVFH